MMGMVPGLLWLLAIAAFGVIVYWAVKNDAPGNGGASRGLLAMKSSEDSTEDAGEPAARWRRKPSATKADHSRRARAGRRAV